MSRSRQHEWVLASSNPGKLTEFRELLADLPIRLTALDAAGGEAPEEDGASFVENALIKARHAAERSGLPAIADDSGLCVDALGGAPGVHSARYAGSGASDRDNIEHLLTELDTIETDRRQASFHCVIVALASAADPAPLIATGRWPGLILTGPKGSNGFGYDPVFFDPELGRTAAELGAEQKNAVSHRGRAATILRDLLRGE